MLGLGRWLLPLSKIGVFVRTGNGLMAAGVVVNSSVSRENRLGSNNAFPTCQSQWPTTEHCRFDGWASWLQRHFVFLLLSCYGAAALYPGPGLAVRNAWVTTWPVTQARVPLTQLLLSLLLVSAGMGIDGRQLRTTLLRPSLLVWGMLAKLLVSGAFVLTAVLVTTPLRHSAGLTSILLGLAIVAAMPAAGSSPSWTQQAGGNVAVTLGILIGSTLISPWWGQLLLRAVHSVLPGSEGIVGPLAQQLTGEYFLFWILIPSALGMMVRHGLGETRAAAVRPMIKCYNSVLLLVLIYAFAASSIRPLLENNGEHWAFVALVLAAAMCAAAFAGGWAIGIVAGGGDRERISLLYGVGMHNNGIALLVGSIAAGHDTLLLLPMLGYALVQHVIAGMVNDYRLRQPANR